MMVMMVMMAMLMLMVVIMIMMMLMVMLMVMVMIMMVVMLMFMIVVMMVFMLMLMFVVMMVVMVVMVMLVHVFVFFLTIDLHMDVRSSDAALDGRFFLYLDMGNAQRIDLGEGRGGIIHQFQQGGGQHIAGCTHATIKIQSLHNTS